jgi:hypothetical protein
MLAEFLASLAAGERAIEATRQFLSETPDFSPISLFNVLDRSRFGVSSNDLQIMLDRLGRSLSFDEAEAVV